MPISEGPELRLVMGKGSLCLVRISYDFIQLFGCRKGNPDKLSTVCESLAPNSWYRLSEFCISVGTEDK